MSWKRAGAGRVTVVLFASVLALAGLTLPAAAQDGASPHPTDGLTATPLAPTSRGEADKAATSRLAETDPDLVGRTDATPVPVVVKFDYDSIAAYDGRIRGVPATSPSATGEGLTTERAESSSYARLVAERESTIVGEIQSRVPEAQMGRSLRVVYGGVAMIVPANRIADILAVDGVVAVQEDSINQILTDSSPDFIGAPSVWSQLSGQATAGNGVLFGGIDTGAWPEHPSFVDDSNMPPACSTTTATR